MKNIVKIKSIENVTHDVLQIVTQKPLNYNFKPGQATDLTINKIGWMDKKNPFTFTCLPNTDFLEFIIKTYPEHNGVTNELTKMQINDELILHDVFGEIAFKGEGIFIAGGAGITPFVSIFRYLNSKNEIGNCKLIFANKTQADIILEEEFKTMLGPNFINILSDEKVDGHANGLISADFIKANSGGLDKLFYVCGPPAMMDAVEKYLKLLQVD